MRKAARVLFTGVVVSFLGALPLGTTNLAATQLAISDGLQPALLFGAGLVLADIFYIYLTLLAMQWIQRQRRFFAGLQWLTLGIAVALAAANFYAAFHPGEQKNVVLSNGLPRIVLGLLLNGVNPMQIPFWFGWSTVLFAKKIIRPQWADFHLFAGGATIGMSAATLLFIFGGRLIADQIQNNQSLVYLLIGGIFCVTALIQLYKMISRKDVAHQLEHPEELTTAIGQKLDEIEGRV